MNTDNPTVNLSRGAVAGQPRTGGSGSALRYEWINLSTLRSTWVLSGLVVLLQLAFTLIDNRAETSAIYQFSKGLSLITLITGVLVAAIGVNAFGSEYRYRTIATTVLTLPSRTSVVLAKSAVVAGISAVTGLLAVIVDYLGVVVLGGGAPDLGKVVVPGLGALLYVALSGLVGLALAGLTRNAVVALGVVLLWQAVLETTLLNAFDLNPETMPFTAAKQLTVTSTTPEWYMPLPLIGLAAVLLIGNVVALSRRDT